MMGGWFMKRWAWLCAFSLAGFLLWLTPAAFASSPMQQTAPVPTVTGTPTGPIIIVPEEANVRKGPGLEYDKIGVMIAGQTAAALGRSPGGEWIQIAYLGGPGGVGWVFSPLVRLEPSTVTLPIVEPPSLPTPRVTPTIDPTLAAQFVQLDLSPTRLPTFTAAAPVAEPTYDAGELNMGGGFPPVLALFGLLTVGILGLFVSFLRGR
jgi:hypothetical protein